ATGEVRTSLGSRSGRVFRGESVRTVRSHGLVRGFGNLCGGRIRSVNKRSHGADGGLGAGGSWLLAAGTRASGDLDVGIGAAAGPGSGVGSCGQVSVAGPGWWNPGGGGRLVRGTWAAAAEGFRRAVGSRWWTPGGWPGRRGLER